MKTGGRMQELLIGKKEVMTYVLSLLSLPEKEVIIKARGRNNAKALDVMEAYRNRFGNITNPQFVTKTVKMEKRNVTELEITFDKEDKIKR